MADYKLKSFNTSYLYNLNLKKHDSSLLSYIMKADRIDKDSEAFSGIREDIKRQQTSAILAQVLAMPNVHLCINSVELPPAFKVFEAFDVKKDRRPAVFIDVTRLIELKGSYFVCKDLGKLITYLFGAMIYLIYRKDTVRVVNNSELTIAGTECYVGMVDYILDYMRIIGYSNNKDKISYLVALFYLVHMLGKECDDYAKNIAAKVSKLPANYINAMNMFIEDGIFDNINDFITFIAETFKLKGFTTEVFISKWIYLYGNGSQYATELFTSLAILVSNAFCGAYVSNQKQIERVCGQSMVKFCNALLRLAVDIIDRRQYMEATELEQFKAKDKHAQEMAHNMKLAKEVAIEPITKYDFGDGNALAERVESIIKFYTETKQPEKIQSIAGISKGIEAMEEICTEGSDADIKYQLGTIPMIVEVTAPYRNENVRSQMISTFKSCISKYRDAMEEATEMNDTDSAQRWSQAMVEMSTAMNYI